MTSMMASLSRITLHSRGSVNRLLQMRPNNQLVANRTFKLWYEKTLKLMYNRSRLLNAVKSPLFHRNTKQEWNIKAELFAFNQRLHENISEESLKIAFTHQSYVDKEVKQRQQLGISDVSINVKDNNHFIQIGQNICNSYIKPYLRHFLPRLPEEGIQAIYDYLMSEEVLSDVAKWIGCIDLVLCEDFPPKESSLAKTTLSIVGAIAEDNGVKKANNFVLDFILTYILNKDVLEIWQIPNPKFQLRNILNRQQLSEPEYRLLRESASGTIEACYVVGIYVDKQLIGSAPGETIELAKQMADLDALRNLFHLKTSQMLFKFGPKAYDIDLSQTKRESLYLSEWSPNSL
ncbi:39S ribosomal protein L44, mitochondrial-like, partial [Oppia nitens]|uniref:39S ribosomal protein L44, mitochondrial-like n=1 Tax=Oppia nitens TaxID=1686743 RepID=UPI0023DA36A0